ncbi:T9SS type A sorting domain-containing protein [Belliella marina]|uniref:T9SS type A sorting domain-containing protein n=1 Tax=Belliella marina TaxID=1644146 RepID=A0ABW4VN11_9BACT
MNSNLFVTPKQKLFGAYGYGLLMAIFVFTQSSKKLIAVFSLFVVIILSQGYQLNAQNTENYNWNSLAIGGGGFVSAIIPSKTEQNLVYARTDVGGAYRWDASTGTWVALNDWTSEDDVGYLGVESLALDPNNPSRLYMLVGIDYFSNGRTAILRSDDYGNSFTITEVTNQFKAHGNGFGRQTGEKLAVDPHNSNILYCGSRQAGLFRSTNAGANWSKVSSLDVTSTGEKEIRFENGISFVLLDPSSNSGGSTQRMFVGVSRSGSEGANFYRSDDGGQSFTAVSGAPTNFMPHRAVLASNDNLYITYANGAGPHGNENSGSMDNGQIWRYNISSGVWTNITPPGSNRAFGGISVDPNNPNRIVASTTNTFWGQYTNVNTGNTVWGDRIYLSTNGGSSWVDVVDRGFTLDTDGITWIYGKAIHWAGSIEFDPFNTQKVWVTSGNGVFVNDNINTSDTWRFNVRGIEETVPYSVESIPNGPLISIIGDYDGFRHTDIKEYAPIHSPNMGTTRGLAVAAQNTSKVVRVGNSMYYSNDMGLSWTQSNMNGEYGRVALSANGNILLHSPQGSLVTYRSTNDGSSWSTVSGLSIGDARPVADPVNSNKFYAYNPSNGAVMVSSNGGTSFSQAGTVADKGSKTIRLAPGMEGHVWIALNDGGLARSTNSGQSFSTISGISNCGSVGFGVAAPGADYPTIYIWGTINNVRGVYRSTDQGASWSRINNDAQQYGGPGNAYFVQGDMNVFGRVYMSTAGRGIAYGEPDDCTPTAITPYLRVNGAAWQRSANASVTVGDSMQFGPQPAQGGSWSWSGPNGFSAFAREVTISNIQSHQTGSYKATYTNSVGCQSEQIFDVTVAGGSGSILREYWTGISGSCISSLTSNVNYPNNPTGSEQISSLEGPTNWGDNYGTRIRGYIHPTTSGNYTFWVAGDDNVDLYLSTNDNPENSSRIAFVDGWTNPREWNKYSSQQSATINLTAGQKYYVEVIHKESGGGDNVAVAWQGPGISQDVIGGSYLSPFDPGAITVRARGVQGDESIDLRVNGNTVATWTLSTSYTDYTASGSGTVEVHYTNDNGPRNVQVDYVIINGTTYQSENQEVNTGVWQNTCGGSFSEWLNCNGYISYATSGSSSARTLGSNEFGELSIFDSKLSKEPGITANEVVIYPNPAQAGRFSLALPAPLQTAIISIYGSQGRLLYQNTTEGYEILEFDQSLSAGVYLVNIRSGQSNVTKKLVIY